jgi:tetratricopeptide (TPR) repeat protein
MIINRNLGRPTGATRKLIERVQQACARARKLEETGDYEAARATLSELWQRVGERPKLDGLDQQTAAEVLLRAGVLSGWIGSASQIEGAQEAAKDLISESAARFEKLREAAKVCEARIELAYCYWREGAFDEARVMLRDVLGKLSDSESELKAIATLRSAIIEASAARYSDALRLLNDAAPLFEASSSHALKGRFHNELASVLNVLSGLEHREDYRDRAFIEYAAAGFHFERARHTRYQAAVENNLGFLFFSASRFKEAHTHLEYARRLFVRLKDGAHAAQVDETRARALLAESRFPEAERIARQAINALQKGDEHALLTEALTTHAVTLARTNRIAPAKAALQCAVEMAEQSGNTEGASLALLTMIEELIDHLSDAEIYATYRRADELLRGAQPTEILQRLRRAAQCVLSKQSERIAEEMSPAQTQETETASVWENFSLKEEVRRLEERYIERALNEAEGRVSHAAKLLGFDDHGSLNSLLKNKHQRLLTARVPATPRKRSIFRKHQRSQKRKGIK